MRVPLWVVLVLIALGLSLGAMQDEEPSEPAEKLLVKAEELAAKGRYKKARSTYRKLAE